MVSSNVIFAPHVDDEVIGCFRLLERKMISDVYYFYDITEERKQEAISAATYYGFNAHFVKWTGEIVVDPDATIYVPNIKDAHPHHKAVNTFSRMFSNTKKYYSIDMNVKFDVLSESEQIAKSEILLHLYPSQELLLKSDDKYHLFESCLDTDLGLFKTTQVRAPSYDVTQEVDLEDFPNYMLEEIYKYIIVNPDKFVSLSQEEYTVEYRP